MGEYTVIVVNMLVLIAMLYFFIKISKYKDKLEETERLKREIYHLGEKMSRVDSKEEAYELILEYALRITRKVDRGSILMADEDGLFRYKAFKGYHEDLRSIVLKREEIYLNRYNNFNNTAIITDPSKFNQGYLKEDKYQELICFGDLVEIKQVLSSPIRIDGEVIGIINIDSVKSGVSFNSDDIKNMNYIKNELELSLKNFLSQEKLKYIASHDDLTGLYNRRSLKRLLEQELNRVDNSQIASQLALIDLDDFKIINDTYGHHKGDQVIVRFSKLLKKYMGPGNSCIRLSGDEFIVILSELSYEEAKCRIEELSQEAVRAKTGELPVYFSYGIVAIEPGNKLSSEDLLMLVDKYMYADKNRKKVYCYRGVYDKKIIL